MEELKMEKRKLSKRLRRRRRKWEEMRRGRDMFENILEAMDNVGKDQVAA